MITREMQEKREYELLSEHAAKAQSQGADGSMRNRAPSGLHFSATVTESYILKPSGD